MQEQNQQEVSFLADDFDLGSMPYLPGLFDAIDILIDDCAKEHKADLTQLKRFVAGHVAKDELMEFEGKFDIVGKKSIVHLFKSRNFLKNGSIFRRISVTLHPKKEHNVVRSKIKT